MKQVTKSELLEILYSSELNELNRIVIWVNGVGYVKVYYDYFTTILEQNETDNSLFSYELNDKKTTIFIKSVNQ